jgi:hypothetical protein
MGRENISSFKAALNSLLLRPPDLKNSWTLVLKVSSKLNDEI